MKILVCGSRSFTDRALIQRELSRFSPGTILVHGDCKTGADAIADAAARRLGFVVRSYPADWEGERQRTGSPNRAGPLRNTAMILTEHRADEPIDLCLAFTPDLQSSRGTRDCVTKARAAGIVTVVLGTSPRRPVGS